VPDQIDALVSSVNKKAGAPLLIRGRDLMSLEILRTTTGSLAFDLMLGGGWPLNCWNEVIGGESHGKTTLVLKTLAANQQIKPGYHTLWIASEEFNIPWAIALGVNVEQITFAMTNVMEEAFDICLRFLDDRACDALVIDSYPALTPGSEIENPIGDMFPALGARLMNKFMRKSNTTQRRSLTEEDRPCLGIIVNQWREKIGVMMGDPRTTPGGRGKNFHYFTRVEVTRAGWIEQGTLKVGQEIKAKTLKNKTAPPQRVAQVDFYFHDAAPFHQGDYDSVKELSSIAMAYEVIKRKGAFYLFRERKWQGKEAVLASIREEPDLAAEIDTGVRALILDTTKSAVQLPRPKRRVPARQK
jgi:recombination protein RecA